MNQEKFNRRSLLQSGAKIALASWATVPSLARSHAFAPTPGLPQRTIRFALIGLDGHFKEFLKAFPRLPNLKLVGVWSRDERDLKRIGQELKQHSTQVYADYHKLLDQEKLDVVGICATHDLQAPILLECAERKIHIGIEKPMVKTLEELEAVRKSIAKNQVHLTMLLPMRFLPPYQTMKKVVADETIGEAVSMDAQKSYKLGERREWLKNRKSFAGIIPYIACHMLDLMLWISQRDCREVAAFQSKVGYPQLGEMENTAAIIYKLDNRGTASIRLDYLRPEKAPTHGDDRLRIVGTKGVAEYQSEGQVTLVTASQKPTVLKELPVQKFLFIDFLESIYLGKPPILKQEETFRLMEILLKSRDAADTRKILTL